MLQTSTKMESRHATWKVEVQKCCKYHATWKGSIFQCRRCHAKWEVLSPQCRLASQNAENIIVHTAQTPLFVSLLFWPWWFRQFFFFLALKSFTGFLTSWLCLRSPAHCNQSHKRTEITSTAYTQTKTTTSTVVGVPPATPPPTTTTTATATTKAATTTTTTTTT